MNIRVFVLPILLLLMLGCQGQETIDVPALKEEPAIDGDLEEWKGSAWHDGMWDLDRVKQSSWYHPKRNKLVRHANEDTIQLDLSAKYYLAWKGDWLYFGAEVKDNVNDVMDSLHEPKRWYYKDAIALFIEAPRDSIDEEFEEGDHAFCFVADTSMPDYGAWWRHGTSESAYVEEPLPTGAVSYAISMNKERPGSADYTLEARVDLSKTLGRANLPSTDEERSRKSSLMIVHCDPDGGEYGGHLLIYGKGDSDASWWPMRFVP